MCAWSSPGHLWPCHVPLVPQSRVDLPSGLYPSKEKKSPQVTQYLLAQYQFRWAHLMIQASELYLVSSPSPRDLTVLGIWLQLLPPPTQTQSRVTPVSIWSSPKLKRNGLSVTSKGVTCRQLTWVNVQEPQNELSGRNVEVTDILFLCFIDSAPLKFELKLAFQHCRQELHPRGLIFQITGQIIKEHLQNFPEIILRHLMTFTAITFPGSSLLKTVFCLSSPDRLVLLVSFW